MRNLQPATQYITPHLAISSIHYLKVTIICRYIFLRFRDFVHFAGIKFCYFEYMHDIHNVILQDSYYYIDEYVRVTSQRQ